MGDVGFDVAQGNQDRKRLLPVGEAGLGIRRCPHEGSLFSEAASFRFVQGAKTNMSSVSKTGSGCVVKKFAVDERIGIKCPVIPVLAAFILRHQLYFFYERPRQLCPQWRRLCSK